jgi:ankyrin repeat protein
MTALHLAAGGGYSHVVNLLLARRARINTQDNGGSTPLHLAGAFGKQDTVKVLLQAGADGNARDGDGNTAADVARANDHAGLATLIESLGAMR